MNTTTTLDMMPPTMRASNPFALRATIAGRRVENWHPSQIENPLRWRTPRIAWTSIDLFHESVPDEWIDRVFAVMALAPQHTFQVLTKRPERARAYFRAPATPERIAGKILDLDMKHRLGDKLVLRALAEWEADQAAPGRATIPLPNVWLGTSVEDQTTADERIPHLLATPAAVRFVSAEPLLGPVDLSRLRIPEGIDCHHNALRGERWISAARVRDRCTLTGRGPCATSARRRPCRSS